MKPRIRPYRGIYRCRTMEFECVGCHPLSGKQQWYSYGATAEEAYQNWLDEPIPF